MQTKYKNNLNTIEFIVLVAEARQYASEIEKCMCGQHTVYEDAINARKMKSVHIIRA